MATPGDQTPAAPLRLGDRLALRPWEAAQALGIGDRKLREMLPELPCVRHGGTVLIPVDALRRWLLEQAEAGKGRVDAAVDEVLGSLGAGDG